ncbi:hypothetical protein HYH02_012247 [Chlamydomonas schloesseri]|uniref:Uncharacterized protein n=1 Tax=Chlamydomonas schloesseri TaxID=2026947 RepID=A0A835SZP9_9CHLO|nr:hypothetical protein HYH02_012247 [Chlamydomonas schloesseri]|eukprot:KAG2434417.1 hypothetical protein HYH02_012247 [Chlamydomonas schloesseri]
MAKKDGDAFGSEIERMLMERPMTSSRQQGPPREPLPMASGMVTNTLDDLMAELGMLRGERGEVDRTLVRNGTRTGPRVSDGVALSGHDLAPRPTTPRSSAAAAAAAGGALGSSNSVGGSGVTLPQLGPNKIMQLPGLPSNSGSSQAPNSPSLGASPGGLGPVRAQSPMSMRRSVAGTPGGGAGGSGLLAPMSNVPTMGPPPGMLERQAQLEMRLEKMEARENQLMTLISQLQTQVSTLSRAQLTTQQQLAAVAAAPPPSPPAVAAPPPAPVAALQQATAKAAATTNPTSSPAAAARAGAVVAAAAPAAPAPPAKVSDEDFIQEDNEPSDDEKSGPGKPKNGAAKPAPQKIMPPAGPAPTPPAGVAPVAGAAARPAVGNKLVPGGGAAEWESDMSQLRKELANLAANLVRLREHVNTIVPGGTSAMSEAMMGQDQAMQQLKNNLTQIAMDVVSLHKGLSAHKQSTAQAHAQLEKSIVDLSVQNQTNVLNAMTQSPHAPGVAAQMAPNAVASALAATGGVSGSLEETLRSAFAKPAMRAMPQFNMEAAGFMPDNSGVAAAAAAYGMGGGMPRQQQMGGGGGGGGGGGLNGAWALLNSFEEQAAQEKAEQQKAAMIAHQAVAIVDAKVKQVVLHVDRHMQLISNDVEERLRMYEQTIIRMAKQIDIVQRVMRDLEGIATNRIVVQRGGRDLNEEPAPPQQQAVAAAQQVPAAQQVTAQPKLTSEELALKEQEERKEAVKANWLKAAAMAKGRFVKQEEPKKEVKTATHGYFGAPRAAT